MARLGSLERREAARRLASEKVVPVNLLTDVAGVTAEALIRWISQGRRGVHLDGYRDIATGKWMSSVEAVRRFLRASGAGADPAD